MTIAAAIHPMIALAFLTVPMLGLGYGGDVQAAAEAEVARQGLPASLLADNNISFRESGIAIAVPVIIALAFVALGWWTLSGRRAARIAALIVMPLIILANVAILLSNAGAVAALQALFAASSDENLRRLDAQALFDATTAAYPDWLPWLTGVRNVVVFGGSVLVIVLLAVRSGRAYFRTPPPASVQQTRATQSTWPEGR
ncbi:hypothetical protein [Catellatospora sichuanensis]|uniref:hypothetical protein n=1 Tax=Catellatospora sichuanensis TaxID=1969805 RepID=UPI001183DB5C|nr:hypothetical protein [Catellatospora sichuanensis]